MEGPSSMHQSATVSAPLVVLAVAASEVCRAHAKAAQNAGASVVAAAGSRDRTLLAKSTGVGRGVPWAPPLLAAIHSAGITQGPVESRPWELWRPDIADFSGTVWFSLVAVSQTDELQHYRHQEQRPGLVPFQTNT